VSGTVTFEGQPLPSGTVLFHAADGRVEHALIAEGGRYAITSTSLGPARITVRSHPTAPAGMPFSGTPPAAEAERTRPTPEQHDGKYLVIPLRYLDPETSGLTYTMRDGTQTHNIVLQQ
jgi:hypothetical protein